MLPAVITPSRDIAAHVPAVAPIVDLAMLSGFFKKTKILSKLMKVIEIRMGCINMAQASELDLVRRVGYWRDTSWLD